MTQQKFVFLLVSSKPIQKVFEFYSVFNTALNCEERSGRDDKDDKDDKDGIFTCICFNVYPSPKCFHTPSTNKLNIELFIGDGLIIIGMLNIDNKYCRANHVKTDASAAECYSVYAGVIKVA